MHDIAAEHADIVHKSMKSEGFADIQVLSPLVSGSVSRLSNELFNRAYPSDPIRDFYTLIVCRYKCLQEAVNLSKEGKGSPKAFLKFGMFCDFALKQRKESSSSSSVFTTRLIIIYN